MLNYYEIEASKEEKRIRDAFIYDTSYPMQLAKPYIVEGDLDLRLKVAPDVPDGITATASGFYAPQGRAIRLEKKFPDMNERLQSFNCDGERITNYEMETSALYGLARILGHNACTVCAIIANRLRREYSKDYKLTVKKMVEQVLERLTAH